MTAAARRIATLRPHELRVLYYAARGLTNAQIARLLGRSVATVRQTRYTAYLRLDVRTGPCAILMLLRAARRAHDAEGNDDGVSAAGDHRATVAALAGTPRDRAA